MRKLRQEVKLLKAHGWDAAGMKRKLEAYRASFWTLSNIEYDEEGQVSFVAEKEFSDD